MKNRVTRNQTLKLIDAMEAHGVDVYMVTDCDFNLSEYTSAHFHALEEFSGFTGGDGRLVVTKDDEAALWTDGRYFEQAENELKDSGITLMRMGSAGVPTWKEWIGDHLPVNGCFGVDGKCLSFKEGKDFEKLLADRSINSMDLCGEVWEDRPHLKYAPCWVLDEKYCGKSASSKFDELRKTMQVKMADWCITTAMDDISWILNLRGNDVPCTPVFMAFLLTGPRQIKLYTDEKHFKGEGHGALKYLNDIGVEVLPYERIYEDIKSISGSVLLDPSSCNYELAHLIPENVKIIEDMSPISEMKCRKNGTEHKNLRIAQHRDGTALTHFIYWLKQNVSRGSITEWEAACKLHDFRAEQEDFIEDSFPAISAYGSNASMAHYAPSPERPVTIEPKGLYLVDSGGQYLEGTTDVTRTVACGEITDEERESFTLVLMANLRLADMKFLEGAPGALLDGCVREIFWQRGLNFNHGTGHGVGFCLSVHEGPAGIGYSATTRNTGYPMKKGFYISDEPGLYIPGKYGIRTENMLFVRHDFTNEYGNFLSFETMTLCPIDKSCIDFSLMEERDIELLNGYHERVYNELKDEFSGEELEWFKEVTSSVSLT